MQQNCNHPSAPHIPPRQPLLSPSPPTLLPSRQLLLRLPSGERLTTAYQPLAHHTAGTVKKERARERETDEIEEEKVKEERMAKEMWLLRDKGEQREMRSNRLRKEQ